MNCVIEYKLGDCVGLLHPISVSVWNEDECIGITQLAFTVVREVAPHIKFLQLQDTSSIPCKLESIDRPVGITLAYYELLFHRATWYEKHFGARLLNRQLGEMYVAAKRNFDAAKPTYFSFNNKDLNILLQPMYRSTATWGEFLDELYKIPYKCQLMFPWYKQAVDIIMEHVSYESQYWIIDLSAVAGVDYEEVQLGSGGGQRRRRTRRSRLFYMEGGGCGGGGGSSESDTEVVLSPEEIYELDYSRFFNRN